MSLITDKQLLSIVPTLKKDRAFVIAEKINFGCPAYGINTKDILEEFLTQLIHESGGFRIKEENMNYRKPQILTTNWKRHFPTLEFAKQYCNNPEKLARYIYGSTSIGKDLGNRTPQDGWDFRGSGFIQVTGYYSFNKYAKYVGFSDLAEIAKLMRTDDYWALDSACWLFAIEKKLIQASIDDNIVLVSKRINGGTIGLKDRKEIYEKVVSVLNS